MTVYTRWSERATIRGPSPSSSMLENLLKRARPSVMKERSGPVVRPSIDCGYIEGPCEEFKAAVAGHKGRTQSHRKRCEREFYLPHLLNGT
jgi:hypothetical protein